MPRPLMTCTLLAMTRQAGRYADSSIYLLRQHVAGAARAAGPRRPGGRELLCHAADAGGAGRRARLQRRARQPHRPAAAPRPPAGRAERHGAADAAPTRARPGGLDAAGPGFPPGIDGAFRTHGPGVPRGAPWGGDLGSVLAAGLPIRLRTLASERPRFSSWPLWCCEKAPDQQRRFMPRLSTARLAPRRWPKCRCPSKPHRRRRGRRFSR